MNEFTDQLKLSKIPDAEIGLRIKDVVYLFVHLYVLAFCLGQTFKNIIETPLTTLTKEWHALSHALNEWTKQSCSEPQKQTEQQSNLQPSKEVWIAQDLSGNCSSKKRSSHQLVVKMKLISISKSKGFANGIKFTRSFAHDLSQCRTQPRSQSTLVGR